MRGFHAPMRWGFSMTDVRTIIVARFPAAVSCAGSLQTGSHLIIVISQPDDQSIRWYKGQRKLTVSDCAHRKDSGRWWTRWWVYKQRAQKTPLRPFKNPLRFKKTTCEHLETDSTSDDVLYELTWLYFMASEELFLFLMNMSKSWKSAYLRLESINK